LTANVTALYKFYLTPEDRNGISYLNLNKSFLEFAIKDGKFNIEDNNSKALGEYCGLFNDTR
jgi:hypothetical protein